MSAPNTVLSNGNKIATLEISKIPEIKPNNIKLNNLPFFN